VLTADYEFSQNTTDDEIGPSTVTPFASLRASSEHIRCAQGKLREGSVAMGVEMLRCAQHDRAVIYTDSSINLFIRINGPY
jgi:hypothetical protein